MMIGLGDPLLALQLPGRSWALEGRGIEGFEWETGPGPTNFQPHQIRQIRGSKGSHQSLTSSGSSAFSSDLCSLSPGHKLKIFLSELIPVG